MFGALDISTSGLIAQRTRMTVISANLAGANAIYDKQGNFAPYRRRFAVMAPGSAPGSSSGIGGGNDFGRGSAEGVHVARIELDNSPLRKVYQPGHPNADAQGYLSMPNVSPEIEIIDALEASRAYEANITAAEATKSMMQSTLRLLA